MPKYYKTKARRLRQHGVGVHIQVLFLNQPPPPPHPKSAVVGVHTQLLFVTEKRLAVCPSYAYASAEKQYQRIRLCGTYSQNRKPYCDGRERYKSRFVGIATAQRNNNKAKKRPPSFRFVVDVFILYSMVAGG